MYPCWEDEYRNLDGQDSEGEHEASSTFCKPMEEIIEKFYYVELVIMFNQIRFDSTAYGSDAIKRESVLNWLPINTATATKQTFQLTKTSHEL